jgi:hypothetical protein
MSEVRLATDGKTRLRDGWEDINSRYSAEEIRRCGLEINLRRDAYPHRLMIDQRSDGSWQWKLYHEASGSPVPIKSGMDVKTPGEAMRRADAANERLVARYAKPRG